mmetsp:Transcript_9762/g.39657  ORF Transcript_9762/g.39657 Transcript_9762/m.39657 type:complete len:538 (+) Transcript_9762:48-1661(+)
MGKQQPGTHRLKKRHFRTPVPCFRCDELIWGLGIQGYRCSECSINVHKSCARKSFLESKCTPGTVHASGIGGKLKNRVRHLKDSLSKEKDKGKGKGKGKEKARKKRVATLPSSLGAMKESAGDEKERGRVQTLPPTALHEKESSVVCLGWQEGRLHIADDGPEEECVGSPVKGRNRKKSVLLKREPRIELPVMLEQAESPRLPSGVSFSVVMTKKQHTFVSSIQAANSMRQSSSLYRSMASLDSSSGDGDRVRETAKDTGDNSSREEAAPTPFMLAGDDGSSKLMLFASSMDLPIAIAIEEEPNAKAIQKAIAELQRISFAGKSQAEVFQTLSDLGLPASSRPMRIDAAPSLSQLQNLLPSSLDLGTMAGKAASEIDSSNSLPDIDSLELEEKKRKDDAEQERETAAERERKEEEARAAKRKQEEEETLDVALARTREMLAWTDQALSNQNPDHVVKFLDALAARAALLHRKWPSAEGIHETLRAAKARIDEGQEAVGLMGGDAEWMADLSGEEDSYSGSEFSFEEEDADELGGFTL